ncbi:DUF2163 domain-containing protein [Sandaracinobacter sp. RS1-74]|uniref:DUF2163 domain-containing protein n=1 Tax=Sandaracinobacteroides sayramensis TaxID=2913411 RepID=UPI001EDA8737|nr:DUF2163 domain-containing protein [Sandaracinobacteroides sayramensis]MCG2839754.1 DUF2163 domain-containing protein [Sandaracinobacteroides sayramensis]
MSDFAERALQGEVTTLALCWKLTRGDGLVLGFASHDRDLLLGGVRYRARPGMTPSAVTHSVDLAADSMEAEGFLSSAGLTELDLESGRWAEARVELFACDWRFPQAGTLGLMRGRMGRVSRFGLGAGGGFRAELLSDLAELEALEPLRLSPLCRAELGDGRCGVDMAGRRVELDVLAWEGDRLELAAAPEAPERYAWGLMRWVSGGLAGVDRRVAAVEGRTIWLEETLPDLPERAGAIWLWEGCDKRFETCGRRFGNALAFDGEPHVPGNDALLRYGDG